MSAQRPLFFGETHWELPGFDRSEIVIVPVPFDLTSSWLKGADGGPEAIIAASPNLEFYDIETGTEVYRRGIHVNETVRAESSLEMVDACRSVVSAILAHGKFPVVLGGEHTVTLGPVQAVAERFPGVSVLHLDAHGDRRDTYEGDPLSHACVIARVKEVTRPLVSVGIRSIDKSELPSLAEDTVFYANDIEGRRDWIDAAVEALGPNVYVTIDLDVFEPAVMPSTGTPEPGGLGWYDVIRLLKKVADSRRVVAFDIVEFLPSPGNKAPDFLTAKLLYTFLSYIFANRK
ncbi:MAG: agmatinase [FCB group bacterium]|nr:agmatinase [FCB group bacterium]